MGQWEILEFNSPIYVILILKRKGKAYAFSFIFLVRENKEEFVLSYPEKQFPPNNSIEIMICETPDGLKDKDHHAVHIVTNKSWSLLEHYICRYPGVNHDEATNIAKFWAQYSLMYMETGSTSIEEKDVHAFKLDEEIRVLEIR